VARTDVLGRAVFSRISAGSKALLQQSVDVVGFDYEPLVAAVRFGNPQAGYFHGTAAGKISARSAQCYAGVT